MDAPPPPPSSTATIDSHSDPLPPVPCTKLRLMCSYGGHIVPRPHEKSLCYAGGDTRIVAVDRRTTAATLSALTDHLSRTLYNNRPFVLKYQLPNEDLDSLISVITDEDLCNMLEEHDRIASSPTPSRIRLFLFPSKPEFVGSVLLDPKSESWFCDALKSTRIIQRGQSGMSNGLMGFDCVVPSFSSVEAQVESLSNNGEAKHSLDLASVPESLVLETSSSFGSTNSSISMANLPPIGVHCEDGGVNLPDKKIKVPSPGSIESDSSVASFVSHPRSKIHQEPVIHVASTDSRGSSNAMESESIVFDPSSVIQMQKTVQVSGYQLSHQSDWKQQQPEVQYVHSGAHYISQYPTAPMPMSSYHPMYHPQLHQQQQSPYQQNQPYPIYLLPVGPPQSYNMPMQYNLIDTATVASNRPPLHPHNATITPQVAYKEVTASAPPVTESATKVYRRVTAATQLVNGPSNQNQQQFVSPPEMHHPSEAVATASMATANYDDEFDDDLAYSPIYKTQPPAPALPPQYQTMTKAATVLLSEASMQLHTNNVKQHIGTFQPQ